MTQQVLYETATGAIIQWQDTEAFSYGPTPEGGAVLAVTADQWAAQGSPQYVSGGAMVAGTPTPALAQAQAAQSTAMSIACQTAITGGFTSSGLGSAYAYPCDEVTQANIKTTSDHGGSLWCEPSGGAWAFLPHTVAQAQQVYSDMAAHIQAQQGVYAGLLAAIAQASTVAAVQAVAWP